MPTHMHALDRHLVTIEHELLKGALADMTAIQDASDKFHIIIPRVNWQPSNLLFKGQFMSRWFDLNDEYKALRQQIEDGQPVPSAPHRTQKKTSTLIATEQMQLAI